MFDFPVNHVKVTVTACTYCSKPFSDMSSGPFQKGEVRVFRMAAGVTPDGDFSEMEAPSDWSDDILCQLFHKSLSDVAETATTLTTLPEEPQSTSNATCKLVVFLFF